MIVSAWYGGLGPGMATTVLSTFAINYFLLEPIHSLSLSDLGTIVRLGVFVMAALLINSLNASQRSAQRKAEANLRSLRESEARFGCLAESNIIGTVVAELDGAILDANHNFLQLVGYTQEDLRAGRLDWRRITPPESLENSEKAVQELRSTGACTPFEKEYIRKDGVRVSVLHGAVMTGDATVTGFVLDRSEQKRLEATQQESIRRERVLHAEVQAASAQLETVLASINDQFLVLDREWRYVYVSDRVLDVVGKTREELLGKCIWELFPDTVDSQFYSEVHRAVAEQEIVQFEYFYPSWQRWFENRVYPCAAGVSILVTDITDRKHAEAMLQRTNQTLQTLLDACPVAIAFFNPQGIVKLWNRAAEQIFGWTAEEAIGRFMPTVPHRSQEFLASLQIVLDGQSLNGFEAQHQRKDGRMVDLEIWANLTHDAEGNPGCLGIAWDISERKQAEIALRTSEERYRSLVATTTAVIWTTNAEGGFVCPQPSWEVYTGQRWEDYAGWGWLEMFHPADRDALNVRWRQALAERSFYEVEGRLWHAPSQQYRHILARAVPLLNEDGSVREWIGMDTDIHDQKQAEEALRQSEARFQVLVSNMPGMVYRYAPCADGDETFTYVSSGCRELVELEPERILQDKSSFFELIHSDDLPSFRESVAIAVENSFVWQWEGRLITPSGNVKWIQGRSRPQPTEHGEVWDGLFIDITDRKQAETEREQLLAREKVAREEAETANRIKDEFLAVLSHELRSPLNPILGWSKLLQTQKLDEQKTQQALNTIERNAKLQTQLIEDLLDISRILRGKLVLNTSPVRLTSIIEAALETVRLAVETKGIHIQKVFSLDDDRVMGDAARLQQVVWNLLSNAVKFTQHGGTVEIHLSPASCRTASVENQSKLIENKQLKANNQEPMAHYAQIQVKDSGKGISQKFLPYVFDYFRQEDGTTTRKFGGLGLGLAIVRHITELHGGTVYAESPGEGLGATFTVQLPMMPIPTRSEPNDQSPSSGNLNGLRILAIDDDADIRDLIQFILEQAGAEVQVVASTTEVLHQLEAFAPQVLIFDIGMPDIDGYMLMRQVRRLPPEQRGTIPAIALTAYAGEINQQQAIAAGFQMHLTKPIEPERLSSAIVDLLTTYSR